MPPPAPPLSRSFRRLLAAAGLAFAVSLGLVVLDVVLGVRLPAGLRPLLPWVLVGATLVGITLLVGAIGTPGRAAKTPPPADEPVAPR